MIKEIRYGGITTTPSDYECPDGDLRASYNLVNEDTAISPVIPPSFVHTDLDGKRALCVHENSAPLYKHVILKDGDNNLYWLDYGVGVEPEELDSIPEGETLVAIQPIGNTLVLLTDKQTLYYLWKEGEYVSLGTMPELELRFANVFDENKIYTIEDVGDLDLGSIPDEDQDDVTNAVLAKANKAIADATEDGCFIMPYFVRYAYRLYDGTTTRASAPILMLPSLLAPFLVPLSGNDNATIYCSLYKIGYFCDFNQLQSLKQWKDIVTGIDFFVSEPIWNYNQAGKCKKVVAQSTYAVSTPVSNSDYICFDGTQVLTMPGNITFQKYIELPQFDNGIEESIRRVCNFHLYKSLTLDEVEIPDVSTDEEEQTSDRFWHPVVLDGHLQALSSRETLPDGYDSHDTITAASAFTFNARLTLANITKTLFKGFSPLCTFNAVTNEIRTTTSDPNRKFIRVKAFTSVNTESGTKVVESNLTLERSPIVQLDTALPRWFYYPNSKASRTVWVTVKLDGSSSKVCVYDLSMRSHDYLNGAYYLALRHADQPTPIVTITCSEADAEAFFAAPATIDGFPVNSVSSPATVTQPNKTYTSEINNPFSFPLTSINTVGTGKILGLATTTTALSQGQFGQFPLYAFTDDGVWALQTSATGSFVAVQPVSRDVCVNAESITQTDNAVLFATDRGIMLLSGSNTICISDTLEKDLANISGMPGMDKFLKIPDITLDSTPFMTYIKGARMIYDYVNQRIVLYNPGNGYAYVFSLKSKKWGMMAGQFLTHANAYPEVVVQDNKYNLVDLSPTTPQTGTVKGLLITRPLKLDGADILKTVNTVLQRGNFDIHATGRRPMQQVIWGSRDLYRWDIVSSSSEWYMRGYRGTPYKYFVIGVVCDLTPDERLVGATIQYEPRYINKPR